MAHIWLRMNSSEGQEEGSAISIKDTVGSIELTKEADSAVSGMSEWRVKIEDHHLIILCCIIGQPMYMYSI